MFNKVTNKLKNLKEFQNSKSNVDMMMEFSEMLAGKSSCKEPKLDTNKFTDPFLQDFVKTVVNKRNKYYQENIKLSTLAFNRFKEDCIGLEKTDQGLKESLEAMLSQTNTAVKALMSPEIIASRFIDYYRVKFSIVILDSEPDKYNKQREETVQEFTKITKLLVKCVKAILDVSGRSVIMKEENLKLAPDVYNIENSVTEKDFIGCGLLQDYFSTFEMLSNIFVKVSRRTREILAPTFRDIYGHLICAIVVANRYIVCFPDAPGKIFNFGIFLKEVKPYSDLLAPFGFDKNIAMIMISDIDTGEE